MMVRDHTAANAEVVMLAGRMGVTLPTAPMAKHAKHIGHLQQLSGTAFDRAYITMMIEAHKDDLDEFEDASKKAVDTAIRGFAARTFPILRMHRDSAIAIRNRK
ncbi:MAG: hypothetical protein JWP69_1046 [Flaviaesturariibacter sp.]|nr:hypothetical protein [Flaviaesturariibacter sp.]